MAYITNTEVKTYLGISATADEDDDLLDDLIDKAQSFIESYTQRVFSASADSTRYFTVGEDTDGKTLYLDTEICSITTVTTDADGTSPTVLTEGTDFYGWPRNSNPQLGTPAYVQLRLFSSSSYTWTYTTAPENGVSVVGKFAYSETPPEDILQACTRLTGYYYRQKDSQVFDITAIPDAGVITIPKGLPADVKEIIRTYRRRVF